MRFLVSIVLFLSLLTTLNGHTIIFLGDSLTAGYNIAQHQAFPAIINQKIATESITIINAGVSGDTTFNLINRLSWTINKTKPDTAFLCIGANDGLRGFKPELIQSNIQQIINVLTSHNITTILAGISLPKNYALNYINDFESIFKRLASKNHLLFYPFLLQDVAGNDNLNLTDRIHPNAKGHQVIAENIYEFLVSNNVILSPNIVD
tara:strand:+ start:115 stop:735 length:621 start_codon:yes stop_codon:yes gene_type:complete